MSIFMRFYSFLLLLAVSQGLSAQHAFEKSRLLFQEYLIEYEKGQFIEARYTLGELLYFEDSLPSYNLALVYNNLGLVSWKLGDYNKANRYYNTATKLLIEDSSSNSESLLSLVYNNTALLHNQTGEYYISIEFYQKAENLLSNHELRDSIYYRQFSMIQFNKALAYYELERYDDAIFFNNIAINLKKAYKLPYLGNVYFNLARCFEKLDTPVTAKSYYHKSIAQWTSEYDSTYFELAKVYLEYGQFLSDQEDDSIAIVLFEKAQNNYLTNYGERHPYTAGCYNLIADYYAKQGSYDLALDNIQLALNSIVPDFKNVDYYSNPIDQGSLMDLRLLKIYRSKIRTLKEYVNSMLDPGNGLGGSRLEAEEMLLFAAETNREAVKVLGRIQESYLNQESRLYLLENQKGIFISGIEIAMQLYVLTGEEVYQEMAHQFASASKALELRFEMKEKKVLYLHSLEDSASTELLSLKEDIDSYTNLIQMEKVKVESDSTKISEWQQKRFDLRRTYELIHENVIGEALSVDASEWFETQGNESSLRSIQSKLKKDETLVEYSISDPDTIGARRLFAFVIKKDDSRVYHVELDKSFDANMEVLTDHLYNFDAGSFKKDSIAALRGSLHYYFLELIAPIEQWFAGDKLIIVPDGELLYVPFEALIREKPEASDLYSGKANAGALYSSQQYLIRDYAISYVPGSNFIYDRSFRFLRKTPWVSILAQDYSGNDDSSIKVLSAVSSEVEAIEGIMRTRLLAGGGTKTQIKAEIEDAHLLHFALHSYPSSEEQDASYLILNSSFDSAYNNLLFDYEIEPLNLINDLVVLNACESGGGKQIDGEGMMSFSRSFILAGARSVVHTLWPVDDNSGNTIITHFYKGLSKGWNKPKALQEAKISYLDGCSPTFAHPYFWAGHQVIGDTSPVSTPHTRPAIGFVGMVVVVFLASRRRSKREQK